MAKICVIHLYIHYINKSRMLSLFFVLSFLLYDDINYFTTKTIIFEAINTGIRLH